MQHAETPLPPGRDRNPPLSAQPWLGRAPLPASSSHAKWPCQAAPGAREWDPTHEMPSWHPRTRVNSAPTASITPILTLLPCMTCSSVA